MEQYVRPHGGRASVRWTKLAATRRQEVSARLPPVTTRDGKYLVRVRRDARSGGAFDVAAAYEAEHEGRWRCLTAAASTVL